jgi:hypothetical protein
MRAVMDEPSGRRGWMSPTSGGTVTTTRSGPGERDSEREQAERVGRAIRKSRRVMRDRVIRPGVWVRISFGRVMGR